MVAPGASAPPWKSWTAEEWEARAERAAAFLERDPSWKVGAEVVAMYRRGAERARQQP